MTECDLDGKIGQSPFVQHELEMARRVGPGGGASHAVRRGDDHIGDRQFFLGISITLEHGSNNIAISDSEVNINDGALEVTSA